MSNTTLRGRLVRLRAAVVPPPGHIGRQFLTSPASSQAAPADPAAPPSGSEGPESDRPLSTMHGHHSVRRVQVGSAISSLAHKGSRLYIGGDAFFAVVHAEVRCPCGQCRRYAVTMRQFWTGVTYS